MTLATDLDGTFLGGEGLHKQRLYSLIRNNKSIRLVFVTGRGFETVTPLLNDPAIPNPDYVICDVGSTIINGHTLEPIHYLQNEIEKHWPGSSAIRKCVEDLDRLQYQEVPQQRRCSFYSSDPILISEVKRRVAKLGCNVIYSANRFLDVLPKGINKGTTLIKLINYLEEDKANVLVAGDTLNDLEMYRCGFNGVVVGNAENKLIDATGQIEKVYLANAEGAGGIIEAMEHFLYFPGVWENIKEETMEAGNNDAAANKLYRG